MVKKNVADREMAECSGRRRLPRSEAHIKPVCEQIGRQTASGCFFLKLGSAAQKGGNQYDEAVN